MDPITIGLIASGVLAAGGGLLSFFGAKKQSRTNQEIANQNLQAQQTENEITREREDNAVQRAARDMELAGLSKTLAAGRPASSQALTAPQNQFQEQNFGQAAIQGISQGVQVAQQVANVQNTVAQTQAQKLVNDTYLEKHFTDMNYKKALTDESRASARLKSIEGDYKAKEIQSLIDSRIEGILKSMSDRMVNDSVIEVNAQKVVESVAQVSNINKSTEKILYDIAMNKLKMNSEIHNLELAKKFGLPVGSMPGGIFGSAFSTGVAGANLMKDVIDYRKSVSSFDRALFQHH